MFSSVTSYFRLIVNTLQNVVKIMFSGAGAEAGAGVRAGSRNKNSRSRSRLKTGRLQNPDCTMC